MLHSQFYTATANLMLRQFSMQSAPGRVLGGDVAPHATHQLQKASGRASSKGSNT